MAKNDITGDEIKSKALSAEGRDNFGKIFCKKTFSQWVEEKFKGKEVIGYDNGEPISLLEFEKRIRESNK